MNNLKDRIYKLEKIASSPDLPPLILEIEDGEGEPGIFTEKDGKQVPMTPEEYRKWGKGYDQQKKPIKIEIEMGEWDLEE
jgi:hypothetical protein